MNYRLYYLLIICFLCFSDSFYAQNVQSEPKSLLSRVQSLNNAERTLFIEGLLKEKGEKIFDDLEKEARNKSQPLWIAYTYYRRMLNNKLSSDGNDSIYNIYANKGMEELDVFIEKNDNNYNKVEKSDLKIYQYLRIRFVDAIVEAYLAESKYELATMYIKRLLNKGNHGEFDAFESEAYFLLGFSFLYASKGEEALENFKKGYDVYKKSFMHKHHYAYFRFFNGMSHAYMTLKDYDGIIAVNKQAKSLIDKEFEQSGDDSEQYYLSNFIIYYEIAYALIHKGELKEARIQLDKAVEILSQKQKDNQFVCIYHEVEAQYYAEVGEYEKAKTHIKMSEVCFDTRKVEISAHNYIKINMIKADILNKSGDSKEAYVLLKDLFQFNDSNNTESFSRQLAEIQTEYMVDKIQLKAENNKVKLRITQLIAAILIIVSLLLIFIVYITKRNSKTLQEKNKTLLKQYTELENRRIKIEELTSLNKDKSDEIPSDSESNVLSDIMERLEKYIIKTEIYKKVDVNREELALAIGTNRQYLIEAIKEHTGKTFNEYIYDYRMKYAYNLMVRDKTKKISEISVESGFLTRGTFNRIFKETYGLKPSELKDILNNKS